MKKNILFFLALTLAPALLPAWEPLEIDLSAATAALAAGKPALARKKAKALLSAHENSAVLWTFLGETYLRQGRLGYARRRFDKALKYNPHHAPAYIGRGQVFEKKGKIDEAANEYQAALRADPGSEEAQKNWDRLKPLAVAPE